jgi:hypothetical protein
VIYPVLSAFRIHTAAQRSSVPDLNLFVLTAKESAKRGSSTNATLKLLNHGPCCVYWNNRTFLDPCGGLLVRCELIPAVALAQRDKTLKKYPHRMSYGLGPG